LADLAAAPSAHFTPLQTQSKLQAGLLKAFLASQIQQHQKPLVAAPAPSPPAEQQQQTQEHNGVLSQMLLFPILAMAGNQRAGAGSKRQLLSIFVQQAQQQTRQAHQQHDAETATSNTAFPAAIEAIPQLANALQIQQQVLQMLLQQQAEQQQKKQELEQQKQQQQRLTALLGILMNQPP
jgi:hypothetical protein